MTSVLNVDTIADKAGTGPVGLTKQHAAKAWLNIDGTTTPASIRSSFAISSLTDAGAGDFTVNCTNAFSNANEPTLVASVGYKSGVGMPGIGNRTGRTRTSTAIGVYTVYGQSVTDVDFSEAALFGDLA